MRQLLLVLLGLAIGAVGAAQAVNVLNKREAWPHGLMNVMQHHFAALRDDVRHNRCTDASLRHVSALRDLAPDIGDAMYGDDTPDAPFREFEQRLQDALAAAPPTCTDMAQAVDKIHAACDACHRQYR